MLMGLLSPIPPTHRSPTNNRDYLFSNHPTQAPLPPPAREHKPLFHAPSEAIKHLANTNYHHGPTLVYHPKPVALPLQLPPRQPEPLPPPAFYHPKPVLPYKTYPKPPPRYLPAKPLPSYHSTKPTPTYLPSKPSPIYQPVKQEPKPYSYEYGVHNDYSGVHYNAGQVADGSGRDYKVESKFIWLQAMWKAPTQWHCQMDGYSM